MATSGVLSANTTPQHTARPVAYSSVAVMASVILNNMKLVQWTLLHSVQWRGGDQASALIIIASSCRLLCVFRAAQELKVLAIHNQSSIWNLRVYKKNQKFLFCFRLRSYVFCFIFGRPFVKRFALCYQTLYVLSVLSVTLMYCGQTVWRIKMKLGMQVGLGPGHIVLDWDQAPPSQTGAEPLPILAHICCGQMVAGIKMPLGMEVGCVRWGPRFPSPIFGPCLLRPNGWMDQDAT